MRQEMFALAGLVLFAVFGCNRSEEHSAAPTSSPPNPSVISEEATPSWDPIGVEGDEATGLDQLVATDRGFRYWEWSLRQTLNLYYPDEHTYEARIGEEPIAEIRIWIAQGGAEPTKNEEGTIYRFDEPGRLKESRTYSLENGFTYVRYSYDESARLVAKETRSAPTNVGWDDALVARDYTVAYEYFEHPGYSDRIYRVATRADGWVDRIVFEEKIADGWLFEYDGSFGGPESLRIADRETASLFAGQVVYEASVVRSRITFNQLKPDSVFVAIRSSGGGRVRTSWRPVSSITYTFSNDWTHLYLADHRIQPDDVDDGVTGYAEHDERGNWLRATRIRDGEVRHIIVREIRYF